MDLTLYGIGYSNNEGRWYIMNVTTVINKKTERVKVTDVNACKEYDFTDTPYIKLFSVKEFADSELELIKEYFANKGGNEEVYLFTLKKVD